MKDLVVTLLQGARNPVQEGRNLLREYLQARILGVLQRSGAMIPLAFQGRTALGFLFSLPRYSEDLDFALEGDPEPYDLRGYLNAIRREFEAEGYGTALSISDRKTVHSAFVRFPGLPFEVGLSADPREHVVVKLEVDTRPPAGARVETTVRRRHVLLNLQHHDRSSLLAGKLHALLARPYLKGRDMYDLLWYLSDPEWPEPNLELLNNALGQIGWEGGEVAADDWRDVVRRHIETQNWSRVVADVAPFLERAEDRVLLGRDNLLRLLR